MVRLGMPGYKRLAKNSLHLVANVLDELNVKWFVGRGTLIGIIRENDFMDYDTDIDIEIYDTTPEQVQKIIDAFSKLIPLDVVKTYGDYIFLVGYRVNKMRIDLDFWYRDKEWMVSADECKSYTKEGYSFYKLPSNLFETKSIKFMGMDINVPKDSEKFLKLYIGDDWTVPKTHDIYLTKRDSPSLVTKKECPIFKDLEDL